MGSTTNIEQTNCAFTRDVENRLQTTDATLTDILSIPVAVSRGLWIRVNIIGTQSDYTNAVGGQLFGLFRRESSGDIHQVGTADSNLKKTAGFATTDISFVLDNVGYNIKVQVKGKAATTINWSSDILYIIQS